MDALTKAKPLFEGSDWNFDTLRRTYDAVAEIAAQDLGLDIYPNQIEIISSEQMLDAYASIGLPLMYRHWSFGKQFVRHEKLYRKGHTGLAYEIVINSSPCISYNMEENSMAMQTLVMAHAAFGHNHFFKNNYLFRQWTDAEGILDYLAWIKGYIAHCEEQYGIDAVEQVLDAAHAIMDQGVFRYHRPPEPTPRLRELRERERVDYETRTFNDLWRTVPRAEPESEPSGPERGLQDRRRRLKLPEENLIYFIEQHSPILEPWQRILLRVVRDIAQYFYPQKQTKVMNEGCATFVHHYIAEALYEKGLITEGAMLEILHNHANVIFQPDFDDPRYGGLNPYALGFAMMQDIRRICTEPTAEDREWFPDVAGCGDWRGTLRYAWANYRDESFIQQFLSPHLIRKMKLFVLTDDGESPYYTVSDIHDERGYKHVRDALALSYDLAALEPDIQVIDADLRGDRHLKLGHIARNGVPLAQPSKDQVLQHVRSLWGYDVSLVSMDG